MNPDHAPEGIDIEKSFHARKRVDEMIEHADAWTRQQNPGDRDQDAGNNDAAESQDIDEFRKRRVGAVHDPGEKRAESKRNQCRGKRESERVPGCGPKISGAEGASIVGKGEAKIEKTRLPGTRHFEARPNDHQQGNDNLITEDQDEQRQSNLAAVQRVSSVHVRCRPVASALSCLVSEG